MMSLKKNIVISLISISSCEISVWFPTYQVFPKGVFDFDMDMSYTRVLYIKVAYRVPHK
jgi:hypothetical protein